MLSLEPVALTTSSCVPISLAAMPCSWARSAQNGVTHCRKASFLPGGRPLASGRSTGNALGLPMYGAIAALAAARLALPAGAALPELLLLLPHAERPAHATAIAGASASVRMTRLVNISLLWWVCCCAEAGKPAPQISHELRQVLQRRDGAEDVEVRAVDHRDAAALGEVLRVAPIDVGGVPARTDVDEHGAELLEERDVAGVECRPRIPGGTDDL